MTTATRNGEGGVTRADIEAKLQEIAGTVSETSTSVGEAGKGVVIALGVVAILVAYRLGRRRGTTRDTIVEIRRV